MKIRRVTFERTLLLLAALLGGSFGYVQDDLMQSSVAALTPPIYSILLASSIVGWLCYILWHAAALKLPSLRMGEIRASKMRLAFLLTLWTATSLGGVSFFLINGMDYMTLRGVVLLSSLTGMAYNGVLVALPLSIIDIIPALAGGSGPVRIQRGHG